jgi:hypothetical protein
MRVGFSLLKVGYGANRSKIGVAAFSQFAACHLRNLIDCHRGNLAAGDRPPTSDTLNFL